MDKAAEAKLNLLLKTACASGMIPHHALPSWESLIRSPCEVTFHNPPFFNLTNFLRHIITEPVLISVLREEVCLHGSPPVLCPVEAQGSEITVPPGRAVEARTVASADQSSVQALCAQSPRQATPSSVSTLKNRPSFESYFL